MKKLAKKLCSIILALCVIFSAVFVLPASAATITDISLGVPITVTLSEDEVCDILFTPEESGAYVFYSTNENGYDTYGYILDSNGEELTRDDDTGYGNNFLMAYDLVAGNTYTLRAKFLSSSDSGSFDVVVDYNPIKSIAVAPINIIEGTKGYLSTYSVGNDEVGYEHGTYYNYSEWYLDVKATVEFSDGSTQEVYLGECVEYNGESYYFDYYLGQSYDDPWTSGSSFTATVSLMGETVEVPVTITESPVKSITVDPVSIIEGSNGSWDSYWDNELGEYVDYFYYRWYSNVKATIEFTDGTTIEEYITNGIEYDGQYYNIDYFHDQHNNGPWTVGNTYTATVMVMGKTVEVPVTITEAPVKSVTVEPVSIVEGSNGYWSSYWDEELQQNIDFYRYEWYGKAEATIEFNDGTVINHSGLWNSVEYNGEYYSFSWNDDQHGNPWTVGNTYTATATFMGKTVEVPVTITESPVKSVTVEPVSIIEGTNGHWDSYWDEELQQSVDFYRYEWYSAASATIEFNDGTVINHSGLWNSVEYNGEYYSFSYDDNQYGNPWTAGNTYTATATFMGKTVEVPVTITESPIESIYVEPISIQEGTNGWWTWYYDDEGNRIDYYRYQWYDIIDVVVEFADGTTGTYGLWDTITYGDSEFSLVWTNETQSSYNPWTVGNTYTEQVSIGQVAADVNITITEAPYESIEILSVAPIKETDFSHINESGNKIYNLPQFTYKINFKDGTSLTRDSFWYYEDHRLSWVDSQYDEPWTIGGENAVTVFVGNVSTTFSAIITEVADWEYVEQNGGLFITNCGLTDSEITVPEEIDGIPVIGIMSMGDGLNHAEIINLPDSVTYLSEEAFGDAYQLYTVNVGAAISELDPDAFAYCYNLYEINVSEDNESLCSVDGIVYNKSGDTLVVYPLGQGYTYYLPDNVSNVDILFTKDYYSDVNVEFSENSKAFKEVDGVTYNADMTIVISCDPEKTGSYDMPDSVTTINEFAFSGSSLSSITVSDNVSEIVYKAFSYCNNLETITLPDTLTSIGEAAFFESNLKNLTRLPSDLTEIGGNAFAGTQMTSIIIPSGVSEIGYSAFAYSSLETLTLSEGIEVIGSGAFTYTNISSLKIPNSVCYMGEYAFAYTPLKNLTLGSGLTEIPYGAFNSTLLTSVTVPKNIEYIGDNAFANSSLSKLVLNASEVFIGDSAFRGCPLDRTSLGNNIVYFGKYAFANNSMTSVKIPDSVTDITYYSFAYSENLASIDIPDNIESVDGFAFEGTAWYESQPDGVVYLENVLYHYKGDIPQNTEIVVNYGTTVIADYAFEIERHCDGSCNSTGYCVGCIIDRDVSGLVSITIPESVKNIGQAAFYGCENLTIYGYTGSYAESYANEHGIPFVAMVDKESGDVSVSTTPDVIDPNATLVVDEVDSDSVASTLPDSIEFTNIKAYDIYFELGGNVVSPDGTVTVELNVPAEFNGIYCAVYHLADDGEATDMQAVFKDGKLVFNTDHFSTYVIVENAPEYISGDANNDGKINNKDLGLLMQYLNDWEVTINVDACDVNRDTKVNNKDYGILMQYLNDWDVELK